MNLETGLSALLQPSARNWLEDAILPAYVKQRRWFASKDKAITSIQLANAELISLSTGSILLAEIEVRYGSTIERYQLPLGLHLTSNAASGLIEQLKLCTVQVRDEEAYLTDAFALDLLPNGLLRYMRDNIVLELEAGQLQCLSLAGLQEVRLAADPEIQRLSAEQSNSSLVIGGRIIMKLIRRVMNGINPEVEMVRYLTEHGYSNTPPFLGEVARIAPNGDVSSIIVAQEFAPNQGDAWEYTLKFILERADDFTSYEVFVATVGTRLAQLHAILAGPTADVAFSPRSASETDVQGWSEGVIRQLQQAFEALTNCVELPVSASRDRDFVLSHREDILAAVPLLATKGVGSLMTRVHGDFHLGQVLVAKDDVFIIDFEGEPAKPLDIRRSKTSPMRDVAGLVRSLHYAVAASGAPLSSFSTQMSEVFLNAYRHIERTATPRWLKDEMQEAALRNLFLLEKSAYEICYEAANRPTWLEIPLRGLAEIMTRVLQLDPEQLDV